MLRYKVLTVVCALCMLGKGYAQELFTYTEPASNMPAHSVGLRVTNWLMDEPATAHINYHLIPEVMVGVNNKLMLHVEGFFSNREGGMSAEGAGLYAKYRFLSRDNVYRHFRMAAFGRASTNNGNIHQEEIVTNGHNTGYQLGLISTQLLHKLALSGTAYYEHAYNNYKGNELPITMADQAINYSLSAGLLVLPKRYKGYNQVNMNVMMEILAQSQPDNGKQYVDIAPSLQFIFKSQMRVDIAYRRELYSNMLRSAPNGLLIRIEHLLFNVL